MFESSGVQEINLKEIMAHANGWNLKSGSSIFSLNLHSI